MLKKYASKLKQMNITNRWLVMVCSIVTALFIVLFVSSCILIKSAYYKSAEKYIFNVASSAVENNFEIYLDGKTSFAKVGIDYIDSFSDKNNLEAWVINSRGIPITSSSGFSINEIDSANMQDYSQALDSDIGMGMWVGRNANGEKIMCMTRVIASDASNERGAVRFISSLELIDKQIMLLIVTVFCVFTLLYAAVLLLNLYFIRSITVPVGEIVETAKKIASGDFNARIKVRNNDELGDLSNTINNMAEDISTTDNMKNDFISTISHELRTPLTSIKGWGETLIVDPHGDPQLTNRGLQVIISESARLSGFVDELLDFSRMANGRMTMRLEKIDILAELDETVFVFKERALREGIEVQYNAPDLPAPALADANRIKQVFVNIMDNALKYNNEGGRVFVSAEMEKNKIVIIVADNGCGIAPQDLPHVKEKFYKANISVKGSGIGLAVANEIVSMHNGKLEIDSVLDEGTTVTVTLPLELNISSERNQPNNE